MAIYLSNPDRSPDSAYEPGELAHLVTGNAGRLLDPRRTPVTVVDVRVETGMFRVRLDAFEDAGATWDVPFEQVDRYQFERGAARAGTTDVVRFRAAVERFDRPLSIPCDPARAAATAGRLDEERRAAGAWLAAGSRFLGARGSLPDPEARRGEPELCLDLLAFMGDRGLRDLEEGFARQYVRNPGSGELVKGHRLVIAGLGLASYEGSIVRDPAIFDGAWSTDRRAAHVLARMGFVRAFFAALGIDRLAVFRGLSTEGPLEPRRRRSFVSATTSRAVARSHYEAGGPGATRLLIEQSVPVSRVFMTWYETAAMNEHYREAEVVLLDDPANPAF